MDGCCRLRQTEQALAVLSSLTIKGISPNIITYTLLIKGYCKEGKVEEAEDVLKDMKDMLGLNADETVYGVLRDTYCRQGEMEGAVRMKDEMLSIALTANSFSCNALINGHCKIGRIKEADQLVGEMEFTGPKPDSYSYNTLGWILHGWSHSKYRSDNLQYTS